MSNSDDEDENLALFLESEILSEDSDQEDKDISGEPKEKRLRLSEQDQEIEMRKVKETDCCSNDNKITINRNPMRVEGEVFSNIPPELFPHILKFLSSEDLVSCSLVCRSFNYAASDESLWRRLYCMRWGLLPPSEKLSQCAWKKLYIQRDEEDMVKLVRNCQPEFKEYYFQMQAAKRSQAPLPSQVKDDRTILHKTVADQVSIWKSSRGMGDKVVNDHCCSGDSCSFFQIGDVFVCEKTGNVHVCDDACREVIMDPTNQHLVCTISGHCYDRMLSPSEMDPEPDQQQHGLVTDEAEPFMGSGRFARAYLLGYNCDDEKELAAALRSC